MTPEVIIIAGGLGTRLRGAVSGVPKPLAQVAGRPFLEHLLDFWIGCGARRFVLSVGYLHEQVEAHFGDAYRSVPVAYAVEREPLGTGGGLLLALAAAGGETVFAANGDSFFAADVAAMHRLHEHTRSDFTLALFHGDDAHRYMPVELDGDGRIMSLKSAAQSGARLANGGLYLLQRAVIACSGFRAGDRVSLEDEILPALLRGGARIFGFPSDARFIDIGIPEDYTRAASVIAGAR